MPSFLHVNDRTLHYDLRAGRGKVPVVFANSLGTDQRIWDPVVARLPAGTSSLRYDKSGHGLSESGASTIADHAADLAALMDALGMSQALVCGVSVGGMIAQVLSATRPDLTAGLILSNTGYRIGTTAMWADRMDAVNKLGLEAMADGILERWFSETFRQRQPDQLAGYRMMFARTPAQGYSAVCRAIHDADLAAEAKAITCKTLCLAGTEDQATPPEIVANLAENISGATYQVIDGVGHIPAIEVPDTVVQHILEQMALLA